MKSYKGDYLNCIAMPLGGIGSGSISIAGNGTIVDAEINNCPNRETACGYTGFAVRAEKDGKTVDSRLLCGDSMSDLRYGYETGKNLLIDGFRHFDKASFDAKFPFAEVHLSDSVFPAEAVIEAYNPFIPSNDKDSSIPAAFFNITLTNTSKEKMTYAVLMNTTNMLKEKAISKYFEKNSLKGITFHSIEKDNTSSKYGNMSMSTDFKDVSYTENSFRGKLFDASGMLGDDISTPGNLKNRSYDEPVQDNTATIAARTELAPGESKTFRFLITWYVPNAECYWNKNEGDDYRNYYSTIFKSSEDVSSYCFDNWERLYTQTKLFADALHTSSMPQDVIDAVSGNLAILKSTTCLRTEDGSLWSWEGVFKTYGSCYGSCQHVYNYAYATAFLFPKLEKGLRDNEMKYNLEENGNMNFRTPLLKKSIPWRSCVDGQMGFVIKCYREWKLSGDNDWLKKHWNDIKKCLSYAWSKENTDCWDPEKSGVISGRQHHTLDVELFGVHSWLTGMYHAALAAAAEMADFIGENELSEEYRHILKCGQKLLDEKTFNGEYFVQLLDIENKQAITDLIKQNKYNTNAWGDEDSSFYWLDDFNQAKYQIENGCEIDQVLADWHADINGLPHVFNQDHRKNALESIYKYNFYNMHDLDNTCRVFACNDEKGVIMCSWPEHVRKPKIPIPYAGECMSGFEYAVAANMLQCGMEDKALEIVHEIRRRYDGKRRNPFSEVECGASYGRAMASYSFLLIYSGFKFDLPNKALGFKPLKNGKYFWSADGAWGTFECDDGKQTFKVDDGRLELEHFITDLKEIKNVSVNGKETAFSTDFGMISSSLKLKAGDVLVLSV